MVHSSVVDITADDFFLGLDFFISEVDVLLLFSGSLHVGKLETHVVVVLMLGMLFGISQIVELGSDGFDGVGKIGIDTLAVLLGVEEVVLGLFSLIQGQGGLGLT